MSGQIYKYENANYKTNTIFLGGAGFQVNDGILELDEDENNKYSTQLPSFGFTKIQEKNQFVKTKQDIVSPAIQPKGE